jgi:cold-inducible RNA-binding protein
MRRVFLFFNEGKNDKKAFTMIRLFRYTLKITFGVMGTPETLKVFGVFFVSGKGEEIMEKKIYVGNISFKATEDDIRELFSRSGEVESVKIINDAQTGNPKGFGFVEMATGEEAQKAIEALNGAMFMERTLTVNEAKPMQPRDRRSGGFGGGKGGFGGGKGKGSQRGWR